MSFPSINGIEVFRLPPEGYVVNFDNPKQQYALEHYLIFGIGAPIAFIALLQRFYTNIRLRKKIEVDDCFMFLGWVCSLLTQALMTDKLHCRADIYVMQRFHQALSSYILSTHLAPKILPNRCVDLHWRRQSIHNRHHSYDVLSLYSAAQSIQLQSGRQVYRCGDLIHGHRRFKHCHRRDTLPSTDPDDLQSPYAKDTEGRCDCCVWDCVNDCCFIGDPLGIFTCSAGNLFVICGSTPTLRQFFKLFMPQLMGSSNRTHGVPSYGLQQNNDRLSRVPKAHNRYNQFSQGLDVELEQLPGDPKNADRVAAGDDESGNEPRDDGSERSILQTRTFTVEYSSR